MTAPAPRKLTRAKTVASGSSSAGVRRRESIGPAASAPPTETITLITAVRIVPATTERETPRASPAPKACAVGTAKPVVTPIAKRGEGGGGGGLVRLRDAGAEEQRQGEEEAHAPGGATGEDDRHGKKSSFGEGAVWGPQWCGAGPWKCRGRRRIRDVPRRAAGS